MNLVFVILLFFVQATPYKPTDEFEIKMDFEFRQRPHDPNAYVSSQSIGQLPYLTLNLKLLKLSPNESRIKVVNNAKNVFSKKVSEGQVVVLDLGFTDDLKGRVSSYEYTALLLDDKKNPISRIVILFEKDGSYLVNGEKRGKI